MPQTQLQKTDLLLEFSLELMHPQVRNDFSVQRENLHNAIQRLKKEERANPFDTLARKSGR